MFGWDDANIFSPSPLPLARRFENCAKHGYKHYKDAYGWWLVAFHLAGSLQFFQQFLMEIAVALIERSRVHRATSHRTVFFLYAVFCIEVHESPRHDVRRASRQFIRNILPDRPLLRSRAWSGRLFSTICFGSLVYFPVNYSVS